MPGSLDLSLKGSKTLSADLRIVAPPLTSGQTRAAEVATSEEDGTEREIDAVVAAGDESRDAPDSVVPRPASTPSAGEFQRLVSGLSIQRTASGGLVVEAPRETASALAALFSEMAQLFQAAAAPPGEGGDPARRS